VTARDHLHRARQVHADLGLPVWVRRTDEELARVTAAARG
jgi:hypothetical protein